MEQNQISKKKTLFPFESELQYLFNRYATPLFCANKRIIVFAWWCSLFNIEQKPLFNVKAYSCIHAKSFFGTNFVTWKLTGQISILSAFHFSTDIRRYSNTKQVFNIKCIINKARWQNVSSLLWVYMGHDSIPVKKPAATLELHPDFPKLILLCYQHWAEEAETAAAPPS